MHFALKTLMAIAAFSFLLGHCDANLQLLADLFSGRLGNQNGAAGLPANSNDLAAFFQQLANSINGINGGRGVGGVGGVNGVGAGSAGGQQPAGIGAGGVPAINGAGGVGVPNNGQFGNGGGQGSNFGGRK